MKKICKVIILSLLINFPVTLSAHVQHYEDLNSIEFDIYRNGKNIGKHIFSFERENDILKVNSEINFIIKKFGVVLYKYHVAGTEVYKDGQLMKFNSKTNQNGKSKYVNIKFDNDAFIIDGSSYKGSAPLDNLVGTWWNHSIIKSPAQISAVSGRIIKQNVSFLGKEKIDINGKVFETLHFNFSSADKKLKKDKKLNTDVWYDENTLYWVKASFKKKGNWVYKLVNIN